MQRAKAHDLTLRQGQFKSKTQCGAPTKLTIRAERALVRAAVLDYRAPLIALYTLSKSRAQITKLIVRKALKKYNKGRRKPRKKPFLKPKHKKGRLKWCRANKGVDFSLVIWSNESTFKVGYDSRNFQITRGPNEEFQDQHLKPTFKSGRTLISMWGCFMGSERGPLVVLPKGQRMNQHLYTELVLKPHFIPFYHKMVAKYGLGVHIQEDGARFHFAPTAAN